MVNEGAIGAQRESIKNTMIRVLETLKEADARTWEQATFQAITGAPVDDVDFDVKENVAGYRLWMGTFEQLATELEADGYVEYTHRDAAGLPFVKPRPQGPETSWTA